MVDIYNPSRADAIQAAELVGQRAADLLPRSTSEYIQMIDLMGDKASLDLDQAVAVELSDLRAAHPENPIVQILKKNHIPTPPVNGVWKDEGRDWMYFRDTPIE